MAMGLLDRLFRRRATEPRVLRIQVSEEQIREKMRGDRDFRLRVTEDGEVSAECKACRTPLRLAGVEGIVWFGCPSCHRVSFYPVGNVARDAHFAQADGKPLEYELFYMAELPPDLQPPPTLLT
jgi:hypothetical protein